MADLVLMPKLGFDMAEGTLIRWTKKENDPIKKGEVLAEIETDKATVEVESQFTGVVYKQLVKEGVAVPVSTPIAIVSQPGEKVDEKAILATSTPLATPVKPEEQKPVPSITQSADQTPLPAPTPQPETQNIERISPLARKMAKDAGIDLNRIQGSGPNGRIVMRDIEQAQKSPVGVHAAPSPQEQAVGAQHAAPNSSHLQWQPEAIPADQTRSVERLRLAIGRRMLDAKQHIPHFYVSDDYDVNALMETRSQANVALGEERKLSVNDFIVKAAALTLRQFPNINSSLNGEQILQHGHIHIGIAVSIPGGLLTVVCRDADQKSLREISTEVKEMAARARSGKVHPEDIEGSTFSISNLGMYDVENFAAIINPPEAAILAVASARQVPVVQNEKIVIGWRMKCTLSADHRVTDGAEAAQFMQVLGEYLIIPVGLMI
jgi:pyruvate dehydrogenase E2 component (dihydrolipoamide acetyltransferase)